MLPLGTQVAIVDDESKEIESIKILLDERNIAYEDFNPMLNMQPKAPLPNLEFIILDLHYQSKFDPEICAAWVDSLISENQTYNLVLWTKDSDKGLELISTLDLIGKRPAFWIAEQKSHYQLKTGELDAISLFDKIERDFSIEITEILGEIVSIEDKHLLINCLMKKEPPVFQVRRFERGILEKAFDLKIGQFIRIVITTEPAKRTIEFLSEKEDHSKLFEQKDFFEQFKDSPFIKSDMP